MHPYMYACTQMFLFIYSLKSFGFWDMTLLSVSCWFPAWLILPPWKWRGNILRKRPLTFGGLNGVEFQKPKLYIMNAVRISNPTYLQII
jgi:hypothetical protein